jgi:hypothetical protein
MKKKKKSIKKRKKKKRENKEEVRIIYPSNSLSLYQGGAARLSYGRALKDISKSFFLGKGLFKGIGGLNLLKPLFPKKVIQFLEKKNILESRNTHFLSLGIGNKT